MLVLSMLVFTVVSIMYSQHDAAGLSSFNAAGRTSAFAEVVTAAVGNLAD